MTEITNKIYYVGVNDRNKHRFYRGSYIRKVYEKRNRAKHKHRCTKNKISQHARFEGRRNHRNLF